MQRDSRQGTLALKIALTLHYLGTGKDYHSLQWVFHVPHNTISGIVLDVCQAIGDEYTSELIKTPRGVDGYC